MKQFISLPRINLIRLGLVLTLSTIVVADSGCVQEKPGCGSKRDHRRRKKSVKKFAPSMSYMFVKPTENKYSFYA